MIKLQNIKIHSICWVGMLAGLNMTIGNLQAQDSGQHTDDPRTVFRSNDWIYWNSNDLEEYYAVDQTPLKNIKGYDTLFSHSIISTVKIICEKPYYALWKIANNKLYLCDIQKYDLTKWGVNPPIDVIKRLKEIDIKTNYYKYRVFERFIGAKFRSAPPGLQDTIPLKPQGVIPATWVNGTFLLKKHTPYPPRISEEQKLFQDPVKIPPQKSDDQLFREAPVIRVTFRNGQVVSVTDVP